jgi:hypothetical protein
VSKRSRRRREPPCAPPCQRPVVLPSILDQPSQAFFPRDRDTGGDLDELTDTDRENTRRLYELTFGVVRQLGGRLQVIALDHADFEDDWVAASVVQRWRGGKALIPQSWLSSAHSAFCVSGDETEPLWARVEKSSSDELGRLLLLH